VERKRKLTLLTLFGPRGRGCSWRQPVAAAAGSAHLPCQPRGQKVNVRLGLESEVWGSKQTLLTALGSDDWKRKEGTENEKKKNGREARNERGGGKSREKGKGEETGKKVRDGG